ncbi:MAG: hypothetical protein PHV93_04125 [Candidatus Pacebacteria bacterium]|nr:hypothetical protein [Candidatus Paceibacterota bacterium]
MKILEKMFGSAGKVKIMRLFLFNPKRVYEQAEVSDRAKVNPKSARKDIVLLEKMGLLKKKVGFKLVPAKSKRNKGKMSQKKFMGWILNESFAYLIPLQNLLINLSTIKDEYIIEQIQSSGKVKLIVLAGIFIQDPGSRVDILVVGDKLKKKKLSGTMKSLEAEIGKELRYGAFETSDFKYRMDMYDKLVRDILDYPHKKILNKMAM